MAHLDHIVRLSGSCVKSPLIQTDNGAANSIHVGLSLTINSTIVTPESDGTSAPPAASRWTAGQKPATSPQERQVFWVHPDLVN